MKPFYQEIFLLELVTQQIQITVKLTVLLRTKLLAKKNETIGETDNLLFKHWFIT